jgi:plastocyanin
MAMAKFSVVLAVLGLIIGVASGCGGSSAPSASPSGTVTTSTSDAPAAEGATITISGMSFGEPITVAPGTEITVVNDDTVEHSVTSQTKGQFDSEADGKEKATFAAPTTAGEYPFYCRYHPNMKGTLIVA